MKKTIKKKSYSIGIDEVGRGALAGPVVVVAAMVLDGTFKKSQLKDSKQLSARQREAWCKYIMDCPTVSFAVAAVHPRKIEKINISQAANRAAFMAYGRLDARSKTPIFLDGGLYLKNRTWQTSHLPHAKTAPKTDEQVPAAAIASIIAKVHRDAYMRRSSSKYPAYGFETHKGYGTRAHYEALKKYGPSKMHRLTFLGKHSTIKE